jgi:hypothetical protein
MFRSPSITLRRFHCFGLELTGAFNYAEICAGALTEYINTENLFYKILCKAVWYHSMLTTHGLENSISSQSSQIIEVRAVYHISNDITYGAFHDVLRDYKHL